MRRYAALFILLASGGLLWGIFDQQVSSIEVNRDGMFQTMKKDDPSFKKLEKIIIETTSKNLETCQCDGISDNDKVKERFQTNAIVLNFKNDKQVLVSLDKDKIMAIGHKEKAFDLFYIPQESYEHILEVIE